MDEYLVGGFVGGCRDGRGLSPDGSVAVFESL